MTVFWVSAMMEAASTSETSVNIYQTTHKTVIVILAAVKS
jgi:hypothetical protein